LIWGSIGGHLGRQWLLPMLSAVVDVARQENNPTSIGLTQYLDPPYWTWAAKDAKGAGPTPVPWTRGLFTLRARVYRSRRVRRRSGAGSGTRSGGAWCCSGSASGT